MGLFTQDVYIPEILYRFLPLLYAITGLLMWASVENGLGKIAAVALLAFALVISVKRFGQPAAR